MRISDQISNLIFSVRIGKKIENISFYEENKYESFIVNTESIKYELKEKLKIKSCKDSKMFKRFIRDKTPKYILDQYNSLKKFLNCNSIKSQPDWDIQDKDLSLDNEMQTIDNHDESRMQVRIKQQKKNVKIIFKSMFLQAIYEASRKRDFKKLIYSESKMPQEFQTLSDGIRINKTYQNNQSQWKFKSHPSQNILHHHKYSSLQTLRIERNYLSLQEF